MSRLPDVSGAELVKALGRQVSSSFGKREVTYLWNKRIPLATGERSFPCIAKSRANFARHPRTNGINT